MSLTPKKVLQNNLNNNSNKSNKTTNDSDRTDEDNNNKSYNNNNNNNFFVKKQPKLPTCKPSDKKIKELLIEALSQHPYGLTVSQLYTYVVEHSTTFNARDLTWQGNVRHLLSKKAYFYKTDLKEATQRGRYWRFNADAYERSKLVGGWVVE